MWAPVWGPKTTAKTGLATEGLPSSRACADIHACRAWRTIARGAAKSWKPSGMQNLSRTRGNNRNLHYFCPAAKILPTKRPPFWGPFLDTKTGAKSPGHKQIKLRLNEWTPFWGPFLDPKTGFVLSAKLLSPSEKQHKFRLFLHVRDRSFPYRWATFQGFAAPRVLVLHTLRTFMSTPVLELGRPSVATPVLLVFSDPKMKATNSPENAIQLWTHQWPNPRRGLC